MRVEFGEVGYAARLSLALYTRFHPSIRFLSIGSRLWSTSKLLNMFGAHKKGRSG
jgi:hypothetical protein